MNKQLLTLGIVLSLGTTACAGVGVQQGSTLTAQKDQGLGNLWNPTEEAPRESLEVQVYSDRGLGNLWTPGEGAPSQEAHSRELSKDTTRRARASKTVILTDSAF